MVFPYSMHPSWTNVQVRSLARGLPASRRPQSDTWRAFLAPLVLGALVGALAVLALQGLLQNRLAAPGGTATNSPAPAGQTANLQVTMSAGLLAALIQDSAARGRLPLQLENVRVQTAPGQLTVNGDVPVLGRPVGGSTVFEPYVADGRLAMRVVQAQFGALPIPGDVVLLAERPMNDRIAAATGGLPATITGVSVDEAGVTISAHVNTDRLSSLPQP